MAKAAEPKFVGTGAQTDSPVPTSGCAHWLLLVHGLSFAGLEAQRQKKGLWLHVGPLGLVLVDDAARQHPRFRNALGVGVWRARPKSGLVDCCSDC